MIHDGDMVRLLWLEQCHQSDYRKVEVEGGVCRLVHNSVL